MLTTSTAKTYPARHNLYFSAAASAALGQLSRRSGRSRSDLVRLAVDVLLSRPELFLRPDYDEIIHSVSGHGPGGEWEGAA